MEFKKLKQALKNAKCLTDQDRVFILEMAKSDVMSLSMNIKLKEQTIIDMFNGVFNKRSRVVSKKVLNKYKELLKHYTEEEIKHSMEMAKADDFHKESGYKYCTIEYFSRAEQIDKWLNVQPAKKSNGFVAPKFYTKESRNG